MPAKLLGGQSFEQMGLYRGYFAQRGGQVGALIGRCKGQLLC